MLSTFAQWRAQTRHELTEVGTEVDVDGVLDCRGGSPRCGCAAASTGSSATARAASWSSTSRPGRRPVSKDDAQRHAQLAMYQLAIAEGLLPQGDSPGGGRLVYLGKTARGGADRARAGRADAATSATSGASWCSKAAAATQGPQFVARINDGCAHCPVRPELPRPGGGRRDGDVVTPSYSPAELASALGLFAPTDEQAAVIAAPPGPLVVIAGAGAGKTETMAARVVWLVANGYASSRRGARPDVHPQGRGPAAAPGPHPAGPAGRRRHRARRTGRGRRPGDGQHLPRVRRARCCASTACCCRSSPTPGCSAKPSCGSWHFASCTEHPEHSTPTRRRPPSPRWCCGWPASWPSTSSTPSS